MKLIFPEIIKDLEKRNKKGLQTYGKELTTNDGRDGLQDLYEELLDAVVYIKKVMMEDGHTPQVFAVDLDGTLCYTSGWTEKDCLKAKPNKAMIKKVNELFEKNFIIIHTARRNNLYEPTIKWLEKNNVKYHAIKMEKMPCTKMLDDKAFSFRAFLVH